MGQAKMKLLSVFALSALSTAEEALNRSKRQEDPATCRANCQSDFDYSFIDDLDACFAGCGSGGIPWPKRKDHAKTMSTTLSSSAAQKCSTLTTFGQCTVRTC